MTCELCGVGAASDRFCSIGLCRTCRDSGADGVLEARGFGFTETMKHQAATRSRPERFIYTLTAHLPHSTDLDVGFRPETVGTTLTKLLPWVQEPTVGDALFDDLVYVDAPTSERLQRVLDDPAVQDVLISICGYGVARLTGAQLEVVLTLAPETPELERRLLVTVLAFAIDRSAAP